MGRITTDTAICFFNKQCRSQYSKEIVANLNRTDEDLETLYQQVISQEESN